MIRKYDLNTKFSTRKSFYGKAKIEEQNGYRNLYSYDTLIASIDNKNKLSYLTDNTEHYSTTTCTHLKEFCLQNGIEYLGKQKMIEFSIKNNINKL